jgi:uncharacterized protein YeaO (DUF488 family)
MVIVIRVKRVYEPPSEEDGIRVLVDRLWPRGVKKGDLRIDLWLKEVAPSHDLRKWFCHRPEKFEEFKRRYMEELKEKGETILKLVELATKGNLTLLYSSKDEVHNNAMVLKEFIEKILEAKDESFGS